MTIYAIVSGLGAAILLLTAGYLFGARQGALARDQLRRQVQLQAASLDQLQEQTSHDATERETSLRSAIQDVLAPLVERERISLDLAQLASRPGRRRELVPLLDRIAEVGRFETVLLTNEEGLPLAANTNGHHTERLAAAATRLSLVAEKIGGEHDVAPLSVMLRDASEATTLCRMFRVQDQTLTLTALSSDPRLASVALDPALAKVQVALTAPA
ncbi:hypothetical protein SSBR45G_44020 [Bradyrhizobium sp. SSBR45G]|uniref:hypothetical protein n=1 Tax=unclassified Bradyrhizobium TaxID=2631580 RepID=UPI00234297BE|nr:MULTISPECIES: hypothetical protein [unclassified Bradyrhizobium]GLH79493.1 hypothetical protein SSBR45G_44020 [Bradyrhizobium sp. SSBR45G]GLH86870.1 hypothetical protein SSBR45R_43300 [Bradyrhizobium sp. SSBR45R]